MCNGSYCYCGVLQSAVLDKLMGLLVDLKVQQLECLEQLIAALRQQPPPEPSSGSARSAVGSSNQGTPENTSKCSTQNASQASGTAGVAKGGAGGGKAGGVNMVDVSSDRGGADSVAQLLMEAKELAQELYGS